MFGAQKIEDPCIRKYKAAKTSGSRPESAVIWIVMHDTEGGTAESVARYFSTGNAGGSAHLVVDDKNCFRCLDNTDVPWGAPGANGRGFHIEQCGFARWTSVVWKSSHRALLQRAAYKAALHCHRFGIPPVFLTAADLAKSKPGITTHAECTKAFGGTHTDPGPGWPRALFMWYVRRYHKQLA